MKFKKKVLFVFMNIFFILFALEVIAVISFKISKRKSNPVKYHFYKNQPDQTLGWKPKPNNTQILWNTNVSTNSFGFRNNSLNPDFNSSRQSILAIGDSFTFGAEVPNEHTWPSFLSRKIKSQVINAGVNGYGLDQMYIHLKQILKDSSLNIKEVIIVFIKEDIHRTAQKVRDGSSKPYFHINEGELKLVPIQEDHTNQTVDYFKSLVMKSTFVSAFCERFFNYLFYSQTTTYIEHLPYNSYAISLRIFHNLKKIANDTKLKIRILPLNEHYDQYDQEYIHFIKELKELNSSYFNIIPELNIMRELGYKDEIKSLENVGHLWHGHLNFRGNEYLAETIYRYIEYRN